MKKIAFLIDTSAAIEFIKQENVEVLPVKIIVNDGKNEIEYNDYTEFSRKDVVENIKKGYDIKTSQTPYGLIEKNIVELLKKYDRVYCLQISKTLSGQYNSYCQIKKELDKTIEKDRVIVVDTNALGMDQNFLIEEITKWEEEQIPIDKIINNIKNFTKKRCGGVIIRNLERLIKGGRLTGVKAIIAKALNLNLIIEWYLGSLTYFDKSLRMNDAITKLANNIQQKINYKENGIKKIVFYTDLPDNEERKQLVAETLEKLNLPKDFNYILCEIPGVVVIYLGNNYFGFYVETF